MMNHNYKEKGVDEINKNVVEQQMVTEDTYGDGDDKDEEDNETDKEDEGNKMEIQGVDEDTRTMDKIPGVGYILQGGIVSHTITTTMLLNLLWNKWVMVRMQVLLKKMMPQLKHNKCQ